MSSASDGPPEAPKRWVASLGDRTLFPDLKHAVYLNHAAISPPSLAVRTTVARVLEDYAYRGVDAFPTWLESRAVLKERLAALIGAHASDIGLVANTTTGIIDIALCFPWEEGDGVVVFEGEFPTNVTPWQQVGRQWNLGVDLLPLDLDRLEKRLRRGGVRLVAASAVQFQTGWLAPLAEMATLCHRYGAQLAVDAIQACGVVPLNVKALGVDYLMCGSHKWLMGLEGCGFLYVHPERVSALRPLVAGWLSHEDPLRFLFEGAGHLRYDRPVRQQTDFVEAGAPNTVGFAALDASLQLIQELGVPAIYAHVNAYLDRLESEVVALGFRSRRAEESAHRSGILAVEAPQGVDLTAIPAVMSAQGISVSIPDGFLRFAPHWPNHRDEVPRVVAALASLRRT